MDSHSNHHHTPKLQGNLPIFLKILGICLVVVFVSIIALFIFKVPGKTLLFGGILLTCPLLHLWMTKDGGHKH